MLFGLPQIFAVLSAFTQGYGTLMSIQAQKEAAAYEQMQLRVQQQQLREQQVALEMETTNKLNQRRQQYFSELAQNRALMAGSGIALDSPSYRALLKANQKTYKKDASTIALMGAEQQLSTAREIQQSELSEKASKQIVKSDVIGSATRGLLGMADPLKELFPR
jgi:hypothetical protein